MRKFKTVFVLLLLFTYTQGYAQKIVDTSNIRYDSLPEDYLREYGKADFILDYLFTDGESLYYRYVYEIVVTDNLVRLTFHSPNSDSYRKIAYKNLKRLTKVQVEKLKQVVQAAQLKQCKQGIPSATFTAYTKEVLIVKHRDLYIAGGLAYGNESSYPDIQPQEHTLKEISDDRRQSSSVCGDYDSVIVELKKHFTALEKLKKRAIRE